MSTNNSEGDYTAKLPQPTIRINRDRSRQGYPSERGDLARDARNQRNSRGQTAIPGIERLFDPSVTMAEVKRIHDYLCIKLAQRTNKGQPYDPKIEDAASEIIMAILKRHSQDDIQFEGAFLNRIVINKSVDSGRRNDHESALVAADGSDLMEEVVASRDSSYESREIIRLFFTYLQSLDVESRFIALLVLQGYSYARIQFILGLDSWSVASGKMRRIRTNFQIWLNREPD